MKWSPVLLVVVVTVVLVRDAHNYVDVVSGVHYQPVDVGFQFSTPVHLSNTLQNVVAGPAAVLVASVFGCILLAGMLMPHITTFSAFRTSPRSDQRFSLWSP